MFKNPLATAVLGLLVGIFVGYVVGQKQNVAPATATPAAGTAAPALPGTAQQPPAGGRTQATANPRLMEQARELERLVSQDPENYTHLVQLGNVYYDLGNFAKAADYYQRARAIRDDSADVLTDLGVSYRELGRAKEAVELFDRAAELKPEHWQSRYNAAVVRLFDLDDPAGAQRELDELKKLGDTVQGLPDLTGLEQEIARRSQ